MRDCTQLTQEERYRVHVLKREGHNQAELATTAGRDPGTNSRELHRNRGLEGCRPRQAHHLVNQGVKVLENTASRGGRYDTQPTRSEVHARRNLRSKRFQEDFKCPDPLIPLRMARVLHGMKSCADRRRGLRAPRRGRAES